MGMSGFCLEHNFVIEHASAHPVGCLRALNLFPTDIWGINCRHLGEYGEQGKGRYRTIMRALIESAMLSWIGTFSCAMSWLIDKDNDNAPALNVS
jgi:hypothetical protein